MFDINKILQEAVETVKEEGDLGPVTTPKAHDNPPDEVSNPQDDLPNTKGEYPDTLEKIKRAISQSAAGVKRYAQENPGKVAGATAAALAAGAGGLALARKLRAAEAKKKKK